MCGLVRGGGRGAGGGGASAIGDECTHNAPWLWRAGGDVSCIHRPRSNIIVCTVVPATCPSTVYVIVLCVLSMQGPPTVGQAVLGCCDACRPCLVDGDPAQGQVAAATVPRLTYTAGPACPRWGKRTPTARCDLPPWPGTLGHSGAYRVHS
jgi:hypothetical protein